MSIVPPPIPTDSPNAPPPLEAHVRELATLAELMLAAAYADGKATWPERSAMATALAGFLGHKELPDPVTARIRGFDPATFDVEAACKSLRIETVDDRKELLQLLSRVTDADARLNRGEADFLRRVADIIGAAPDELEPFIVPD